MWTYAREKKMKNTHTLNWERPYKENIQSSFFLRWLCRCHTDCHKQDKRKKKKNRWNSDTRRYNYDTVSNPATKLCWIELATSITDEAQSIDLLLFILFRNGPILRLYTQHTSLRDSDFYFWTKLQLKTRLKSHFRNNERSKSGKLNWNCGE